MLGVDDLRALSTESQILPSQVQQVLAGTLAWDRNRIDSYDYSHYHMSSEA